MVVTPPIPSGRGLRVVGIALLILGFVSYAVSGGPEESPTLSTFAVALMIGGVLIYFRARRQRAKFIASSPASPLHDDRPDVLYLRAFGTDTSGFRRVLLSGLSSEEEQLAEALRPFGEMVAVGRPGESLPLPGAVRMYASDAEWRTMVMKHMRAASLVVLRAGTSAGLVWEVEQALLTRTPETVLILVLNLSAAEYFAFSKLLRERFRLSLPEIARCSLIRAVVDYHENPTRVLPGFVCFGDAWNATFLPLPFTVVRFRSALTKRFRKALRPVFQTHSLMTDRDRQ